MQIRQRNRRRQVHRRQLIAIARLPPQELPQIDLALLHGVHRILLSISWVHAGPQVLGRNMPIQFGHLRLARLLILI